MTTRHIPQEQTADTRLGRALNGAAKAHPGEAGFLPVADGIDALAIRLLLADKAERSIDTQYYEIEDDLAGRLFIEALLRAADRGVRVRLLLDDYRTKGHDSGIAALRSHENFELRIYNPYLRRSSRLVEGMLSFTRINRRMHNKSFTADNQMSVIGGRNIGDHYFSVGHEVNFADLDVICIGPVVSDISRMFDDYWNSPAAIPVDRLGMASVRSGTTLQEVIDRVSRSRAYASKSKYSEAVRSAILDKLEGDLSGFTWASYELAYDLPQKTQRKNPGRAAALRQLLVRAFDEANEDVILVSPYFVPRLTGLRRFRQLRERGVSVTVVTNSLASNNQIYAHGGYAPIRKPLLKTGVRLFELRADAKVVGKQNVDPDSTKATLHTKAFAIDRRKLFIGSFNFDPRSANLTTAMGVFIDSPKLAEAFVSGTNKHAPRHCFEVTLRDDGSLSWHCDDGEAPTYYDREPQAGFWQRVAGQLARMLPIRGQV